MGYDGMGKLWRCDRTSRVDEGLCNLKTERVENGGAEIVLNCPRYGPLC